MITVIIIWWIRFGRRGLHYSISLKTITWFFFSSENIQPVRIIIIIIIIRASSSLVQIIICTRHGPRCKVRDRRGSPERRACVIQYNNITKLARLKGPERKSNYRMHVVIILFFTFIVLINSQFLYGQYYTHTHTRRAPLWPCLDFVFATSANVIISNASSVFGMKKTWKRQVDRDIGAFRSLSLTALAKHYTYFGRWPSADDDIAV